MALLLIEGRRRGNCTCKNMIWVLIGENTAPYNVNPFQFSYLDFGTCKNSNQVLYGVVVAWLHGAEFYKTDKMHANSGSRGSIRLNANTFRASKCDIKSTSEEVNKKKGTS